MNSDINYFFTNLFQSSDADLFGFLDVLMAMTVTSLLCFVLAHVYRITHRGTSYSQSFLVTLFIMGVATSVVMLIIGSNIARAFSLVGALSIIRFRTAVKDARDTGFLFAAMITGMGCGTTFYMPAISLTAFISLLVLGLYYFDYGIKQKLESIVRVTFKDGEATRASIEKEFGATYREFTLINRILEFDKELVTNVYVVRPDKDTDVTAVEGRLRNLEGIVQVSHYQTDQHAPF